MARDNSTAEAIRDASVRLFASKGFEATGIRDIARDVGLTPGAIYHYIGTKEDLLVEIMRAGLTNLIEDATAALAGAPESPAERLAALVAVHVRTHGEAQLEALVGDQEVRALTETNRRNIVKLRDEYEALWAEVITEGVRAGLFRIDDERLYRLATIQMCTGVANWYSDDGPLALDEVIERFTDMALQMAGVASSSPERRVVRLKDERGRRAGGARRPRSKGAR